MFHPPKCFAGIIQFWKSFTGEIRNFASRLNQTWRPFIHLIYYSKQQRPRLPPSLLPFFRFAARRKLTLLGIYSPRQTLYRVSNMFDIFSPPSFLDSGYIREISTFCARPRENYSIFNSSISIEIDRILEFNVWKWSTPMIHYAVQYLAFTPSPVVIIFIIIITTVPLYFLFYNKLVSLWKKEET